MPKSCFWPSISLGTRKRPKRPGVTGRQLPIHLDRVRPQNLALSAGPEVASRTLALGLATNNSAVEIGALHALAAVGARAEIYGSHSFSIAPADRTQRSKYGGAIRCGRRHPAE